MRTELQTDLSNDQRVCRSELRKDASSYGWMLITQYGWKNAAKIVWDKEIAKTPIRIFK